MVIFIFECNTRSKNRNNRRAAAYETGPLSPVLEPACLAQVENFRCVHTLGKT